jgi:hypothetical protein
VKKPLRLPARALAGAALAILALGPVALGPAASAAGASSLPTLSLSLGVRSLSLAGPQQSGAVDVLVRASAVKQAGAALFRLSPGVSLAEVEALLPGELVGDMSAADRYGSFVLEQEAPTQGSSEVQIELLPGEYLALTLPGEGEAALHVSFSVYEALAPTVLPIPEATLRASGTGLHGPSALHDGELVRFEDEGNLVHADFALPVRSVAGARKVLRLLLAGRGKALGGLLAGAPVSFAGPLSPGAYQQETITAPPGVYVEVCSTNAQEPRARARRGMDRIIEIAP